MDWVGMDPGGWSSALMSETWVGPRLKHFRTGTVNAIGTKTAAVGTDSPAARSVVAPLLRIAR